MKFTLTFILSVLHFTSFCQITAKDIERRDTIVGKKTDGTDINGTKHAFNRHVLSQYNYDSIAHRLILIAKDKDQREYTITSLNTVDLSINWSKRAKYKEFLLTHNTVIEQGKWGTCYNALKGELIWQDRPRMVMFDKEMEVGISAKGLGYDLRTGNEIWMRNLDYQTGLKSATKTDDSTLFLVTTQALHRVNTKTSRGWKYNLMPILSEGSTSGAYAAAAGFGLIGAIAMLAVHEARMENGTLKLANVVIERDKAFIVSDKKLACMNMDNIEWEVNLPKDFIRPTVIKSTNNHIWVFGKKSTKEKHRKEKPAYFVFDKLTGKAKWEFAEDSSTNLKDVTVQNDHIIILFNNRVYIVDAATNTILTNLGTTELTNSCTGFFEPASFQIEDGRKLTKLKEKYPDHIFLNKDTNTIYRYNDQFVFQDSVATRSLFLPYASYQGNIIARNSKEPNISTFITNGEKKATIYSDQVFFANDRIIAIKDNYILSIDLAQLTN